MRTTKGSHPMRKRLVGILSIGLILAIAPLLLQTGCGLPTVSPVAASPTIPPTGSDVSISTTPDITPSSPSASASPTEEGGSVTPIPTEEGGGVTPIPTEEGGVTPIPTATVTSAPRPIAGKVTPVMLPSDRVRSINEMGLTEASYRAMTVQPASYAGNAGWDVSSICLSPYYALRINQTSVPVYASPVYVADGNAGALQSFAMVDVPQGDFYLDVTITARNVSFQSAMVLPANLGIDPEVTADRTISARVTGYGIYTFLVADAEGTASQQFALVLLVRRLQDEEAEIAQYKADYGADHVTVYEAGTHYVDHIEIQSNDTVVYLRRGSLLVAKHSIDIDSDMDNQNRSEPGASASNGWGLNRYPFLTAQNKTNVRIVGRGTMDLGQLDWHERRGLLFTGCAGVVLDGVNLVNFPEWSFTSYRCVDVSVRNVMVLGWKTNSDAFVLCNTTDSIVESCFARTGDDMFEVKTLGGPAGAVSEDIVFTRCLAWGSKARAFGVTGEVEKDIRRVTYRDSAVLFRDAIWDNDRLASLVIIVENGDGNISDVRFENIEIHYDFGRAINATIIRTDSAPNQITGLVFENITYRAGLPSQIRTRTPGDNRIEAVFRNVRANGVLLTEDNAASAVQVIGPGSRLTFE